MEVYNPANSNHGHHPIYEIETLKFNVHEMTQSWVPQESSSVLKGTVKCFWTEDRIVVIAQLPDDDIFSDASSDSQKTWELGDVFEVFWKDLEDVGYNEVHVTPTNCRLWIRFPSVETIARIRANQEKHERYVINPDEIRTHVSITQGAWTANIDIPRQNKKGDILQISFCRYDAHRDGTVDFSSTSPHPVPDFHRPQDWPYFQLV